MKKTPALKPKHIQKLSNLELKHPGDLTQEEFKELQKLQHLRAKYGKV